MTITKYVIKNHENLCIKKQICSKNCLQHTCNFCEMCLSLCFFYNFVLQPKLQNTCKSHRFMSTMSCRISYKFTANERRKKYEHHVFEISHKYILCVHVYIQGFKCKFCQKRLFYFNDLSTVKVPSCRKAVT